MALRGAIVLASVAMAVSGCQMSTPATEPTFAPDANTTTSAAPAVQAGPFGTTMTVTESGATAAYTVSNLRPVPVDAQIVPPRGTMYAVDVVIDAQTGTTAYNGYYFVAKAADGVNFPPAIGAVRPDVDSGQLAAGQSLSAHVAFDVPEGQAITRVVLRDPKGNALAVWGIA